jgi:peptide/nickel transport system permease protein
VILARLPTTIFLTLYAVTLSILIAGPLAFLAAVNRGKWQDNLIRAVFQVGLSMPVFYIGLILLTFLAAQLRLFPVGGYGETFADRLYHLFLPAVTVALYTSAILMRNLRSAIIEVLDAEYVQFARAKGLPNRLILGRHVLKNALISTVTLLGLSIGQLMSGTLVTETVFAVPGVGRSMLEAIFARDYPLIQGLTLTFARYHSCPGCGPDEKAGPVEAGPVETRLHDRCRHHRLFHPACPLSGSLCALRS